MRIHEDGVGVFWAEATAWEGFGNEESREMGQTRHWRPAMGHFMGPGGPGWQVSLCSAGGGMALRPAARSDGCREGAGWPGCDPNRMGRGKAAIRGGLAARCPGCGVHRLLVF